MMKCFKCYSAIFMSLVAMCNSVPRDFNRHRIFRLNYENPLRIIGGSPANIEDYPYQVLLMIDDLPNCGGSIVTENFVLTAAHCIYDVDPHHLTIRAGSANRTTGGQVVGITYTYYPDSFNIDTYDYDVAILELATPLVLNEQVGTIDLPSPGYNIAQGEIATATGWGQTDPDDSTLPVILQRVELPEIVTQTCRNYYGSLITNRMFCAGYKEGGKDTCLGDSGGPLTANGYLLGITSWGSDRCAQSGSPGVFTKVAYFREYIDDILNSVDRRKAEYPEHTEVENISLL